MFYYIAKLQRFFLIVRILKKNISKKKNNVLSFLKELNCSNILQIRDFSVAEINGL